MSCTEFMKTKDLRFTEVSKCHMPHDALYSILVFLIHSDQVER